MRERKLVKVGQMDCEYGCGQEARYTLKNGKGCCSKFSTRCPTIKKKTSDGIAKAHAEGRCTSKGFDKEGARNWAKGKTAWNDDRVACKHKKDEMFVENSRVKPWRIKEALIEILGKYKCCVCGIGAWQEQPITLELHHKNGNRKDNRLENLTLLCPNCHSQTDTFRNIKGNGKTVTDEELLESITKSYSINEAFERLGTQPGGKYGRARLLMEKHNIQLKKRMTVNDDGFLPILQKSKSIKEALKTAGMRFTKENYSGARTLMEQHKIVKKRKEKKETYCNNCGKLISSNAVTGLCQPCYKISIRKAERPPLEILLKQVDTLGYSATGRLYGVSDSCIRKWLVNYK